MIKTFSRVITLLLVFMILRMALSKVVNLIHEIVFNTLTITNKALVFTNKQLLR